MCLYIYYRFRSDQYGEKIQTQTFTIIRIYSYYAAGIRLSISNVTLCSVNELRKKTRRIG